MMKQVSSNKAILSAFQSVLISWGDVDITVPAWVAWRIRFSLQQATQALSHGQHAVARVQHAVAPQPDPWRLSLAAAETIEAVTQMVSLASLMPEDVGAQTRAAINKRLAADIDEDWCGTPPRWKGPFPPRKLGDVERFDPADFIVSAVLFHAAAESVNDDHLAREFGGIADRLLERGLQGA
jgi:hypothetical protein